MSNELSDLIRLTPEEVYGPEVDLSVFDEPVLTQERWTVGFTSNFVVVGNDPEYADMSNPNGDIIQERFYMVAEDAKGNRRTWGGMYDSPEAAEAAYAFLAPTVALWEEMRPTYGSEAYAANWQEFQADDERREREAEGIYGDDFNFYEGPDFL